jgi:hypothetical protein
MCMLTSCMVTASSHNIQLLRSLCDLAGGPTTGILVTLQRIVYTAFYIQGAVAVCCLQTQLLLLMVHAKTVQPTLLQVLAGVGALPFRCCCRRLKVKVQGSALRQLCVCCHHLGHIAVDLRRVDR